MFRRSLVIVALVTTLFGATASPATSSNASPFVGACPVDVTFYFTEVVRLLTTQRGVNVEINGNCPLITSAGTGSHDLFGDGGGQALLWNCEITQAEGNWTVWTDPGPPHNMSGNFDMVGSFGGWDLVFTTQGGGGHAHLVLNPNHIGAPLECEGDGLWELRMTGTLEFAINV